MNSDAAIPDSNAGHDELTPQTPGALIRRARERAKLSIGELASLTKLPMATIEALERDDFAQLSEPVYARGYYRKCAKSLALSEAELIAGYDRMAGPRTRSAPVAKLLLSTQESETRAGLKRYGGGRWMTILLVAVVIGVAIIGYAMSESKEASWLPANAPGVDWLKGKPVAVDAPSGEPAAVSSSAAPAPTPQTTTASALPEAVPSAPSANPAAVAPHPVEAAGVSEPSVPSPGSAAAASVGADPAATPAVSVTPGLLDLNFGQASWVRVEDANGKLLLTGLMAANTHQRLRGATPYSILVGNVQGLTILFEGQSVDLTPYTRANSTARIRIP